MAVWANIIFFTQNFPLLPSRLLLSVPDLHRFLRKNKISTLADYHRRSGITPCLEDSLLNMYLLQIHYIENGRSVNRCFGTPFHIFLKNVIFVKFLFLYINFVFPFLNYFKLCIKINIYRCIIATKITSAFVFVLTIRLEKCFNNRVIIIRLGLMI